MRRRFATAALVIAWLCAHGAVWDVLQFAAWGKMFAGYSVTMSPAQALNETLDPAKPCDLCTGIAKARAGAKEKLPATEQQQAAKLVLALQAADSPDFAHDPGRWLPAPGMRRVERTDPVPLPPPRV